MHPRTRLVAVVAVGTTVVAVGLSETGLAPELEPLSVAIAYLVLAVAGSLIDRSRHSRTTVFLAAVLVGLVAVLLAWVTAAVELSIGTCGGLPYDPACPSTSVLETTGIQTLTWIAPLGALFALGAAGTKWGRRAIAVGLATVLLVGIWEATGYPPASVEGLWVSVLRAMVAVAMGIGALAYGRAVGLSAAA